MTLRNKSARDSFRTTSEAAALKRAFFGVANFSFFFFLFLGFWGEDLYFSQNSNNNADVIQAARWLPLGAFPSCPPPDTGGNRPGGGFRRKALEGKEVN